MPGLRKRSVALSGHATSLALEPEFWAALEAHAAREGVSLAALIGRIDAGRRDRPLASACRVYALQSRTG
jgi:predicted DNA-binding ribbon-helix-helix protein